MRPTKPANPQPNDYEPVEQPEQKPKICPYCGKQHWSPWYSDCGSAECIAESVVTPLKRWDAEADTVRQMSRPCPKCGRRLIGPWETHARCSDRHELEWEEANNG